MAGDQVLNGALVFIAYQFTPLILKHLNLSHLKNNKNYKPHYQTATFLHLEFLSHCYFFLMLREGQISFMDSNDIY